MLLYAHPLASYCWKVLIALYEYAIPFEFKLVDLADPVQREELEALWPLVKFPLLRDGDLVIPESTIILEHLAEHHGARALLPANADAARPVRLWDRIFDNYVQEPMQRIIADALRPADSRDPFGVAQEYKKLASTYAYLDRVLAAGPRPWGTGDALTLADCSAFPALFYADVLEPIAPYPHAAAYLERLRARPSVARVLDEARPHFKLVPVQSPRLR